MTSPFSPADPTIFFYDRDPQRVIMYRLSKRIKTQDAITRLTAVFNKYNPALPYTYTFSDQSYASKFSLELLIGKLAGLFAGLAIFISCLGLFGLAAYIAEQRNKEIGIRKVLGLPYRRFGFCCQKNLLSWYSSVAPSHHPLLFTFCRAGFKNMLTGSPLVRASSFGQHCRRLSLRWSRLVFRRLKRPL